MTFRSILFQKVEDSQRAQTCEQPACFPDLNLDQVIAAVTASRQEYNLKPFFHAPLKDADAIRYRHEVMRDLQNSVLREAVKAFAHEMQTMRQCLVLLDKLDYTYNKEGWFLAAVEIYCDAVGGLLNAITPLDLRSRGFLAFREYMANYTASERFMALLAETRKLRADLGATQYCILVKGNRVTVRKYESEIDYSADVERTFEKFKQGAVKDYRIQTRIDAGLNHVEAQVLDLVARLYPEKFAALDDYCAKNSGYRDETIAVFDREVQFYIAYLEHVALFEGAGLRLCYPEVAAEDKEVLSCEGYDLALAAKLIAQNSKVVRNDFYLKGKERILVVSGPNQGGKTTFARMFGQLHYLASVGCPVPGSRARLFLFDGLFTHFEKEEDIANLRGKLQDDMVRIHDILRHARPSSIVIMNEMFTSTALEDAVFLGKKIMERLMALDALCVYVTFIDELASLSEQTVSMVSTVVPENPTLRTFKIVRKPADGLSYALSIAEEHRLTYERLKERLKL